MNTVSVHELLEQLPRYRDQWIQIHPDQSVPDIINEVLEAHQEFGPQYDLISSFFDCDTLQQTCDCLYTFLKRNVKYKEESHKQQTSTIPAGLLIRGHGDCKHYSGFTAGILDSLKRSGKKINWCYRFASYRILDKTPHHVFVVVNPGTDREIWIDPTPGAEKMQPLWVIDKKCTMALHRNIAGLNDWDEIDLLEFEELPGIGKGPYWQLMPAEGVRGKDGNHGTNPYFSGPFLGLQHYKNDPYSIEGTNWQTTADAINAQRMKGPSPDGYKYPADFVKWIYENSIRNWNFYYPDGVAPGYKPNLPEWYPKLVITPDFRLTLDREYPVYHSNTNDEIAALTAWAQALINEYDETPYPLKPADLQHFSNTKGMPNDGKSNLFNEHRGKGFFDKVGEALSKAVKVVTKGVLKIVGSIPRNAFLGLVGLNAFNFAGNMWEKIQAGQWDKIAEKWRKLGGNPQKLRNTIEEGKDKKAILGDLSGGAYIGEAATGSAALLAAAAPIIAALITFLDKEGKAKEVLQVAKASLQKIYPDLDLSAFGFLDKDTGKELEFEIDPADDENLGGGDDKMPPGYKGSGSTGAGIMEQLKRNPALTAAGAGVIVYFIQGKKKSLLLPAIAAGGVYFLLAGFPGSGGSTAPALNTEQMKAALISLDPGFSTVLAQMTPQEVSDTYTWTVVYAMPGKKDQAPADLVSRVQAISDKYKIFT